MSYSKLVAFSLPVSLAANRRDQIDFTRIGIGRVHVIRLFPQQLDRTLRNLSSRPHVCAEAVVGFKSLYITTFAASQ